jgi:TetR/AcrR family transcriptional regulator, lmrAB and yxaGH operons repressor
MTKGEITRGKLVDATAELLRRQGYHATGLAEIVAESGAPRGSVYFYFPGGKDELACEALVKSGEQWTVRINAALAAAPDLDGAIAAIIELLAVDLEASGFEHGCPVAAVALEATSPAVRAAVAEHYASWQASIAARLVTLGFAPDPAAEMATVALAMIEGGLLLARVARDRAPLVAVGRTLRMMLARSQAPGSSTRAAPRKTRR